MIRGVLFDLGGLFVRPTTTRRDEVGEHLGLPLERIEEFTAGLTPSLTTGQLSLRDFYRQLVAYAGRGDPDHLLQLHLERFTASAHQWEPRMVALVEELRPRYGVACLSNTEVEGACIARQSGLCDLFDKSYLSVELGMKKPDAEIYRAALDDWGMAPAEVLFTDDVEENVRGAQTVGMPAHLFVSAERLREELETRWGLLGGACV